MIPIKRRTVLTLGGATLTSLGLPELAFAVGYKMMVGDGGGGAVTLDSGGDGPDQSSNDNQDYDQGDQSDSYGGEAPSLDSSDQTPVQRIATGTPQPESGDESVGTLEDTVAAPDSAVDSAIDAIKKALSDVTDTLEEATAFLQENLYACVDVSTGVSAGYCITADGDLYETQGVGTPGISLQVGIAFDADTYLAGGSISASYAGEGVGVTPDGQAGAAFLGLEAPGASYSYGTKVGNVFDP